MQYIQFCNLNLQTESIKLIKLSDLSHISHDYYNVVTSAIP